MTESKLRVGILISSTLYPNATKPLSYTSQRSVFSNQQRVEQTLETIKTCREKIPSSYIVLADNSFEEIDEKTIAFLKKTGVNTVIQKYKEEATDSIYKARGEAFCTLLGIEVLQEAGVDLIFKISGRYHLTDKFDLSQYQKICEKGKFAFWQEVPMVRTVFYALPFSLLKRWKEIMSEISVSESQLGLEYQVYPYVCKESEYVEILGCAGLVSIDGTNWCG